MREHACPVLLKPKSCQSDKVTWRDLIALTQESFWRAVPAPNAGRLVAGTVLPAPHASTSPLSSGVLFCALIERAGRQAVTVL